MKKPLRVGFDLDGVLLYNPARIVRQPVSLFKRYFLKRKQLKFYYPKSALEKKMWHLFHKSSIFVAPGFEDVKRLAKKGHIEAYIITARYSFLEDDFKKWLEKMKINHVFKGAYLNKRDEQPHLFKERLIKKFDLDIFIEDNWDIVNHTSKKTKARVYWIYNIVDRIIDYPHKFPGLKYTVEHIKKAANAKKKK